MPSHAFIPTRDPKTYNLKHLGSQHSLSLRLKIAQKSYTVWSLELGSFIYEEPTTHAEYEKKCPPEDLLGDSWAVISGAISVMTIQR